MFGLLHVRTVDRQNDITFAHATFVCRPAVLDVINVGYHFDFVLFFVVDAIALQGETVRAVLLFDDDGAPVAGIVRFG